MSDEIHAEDESPHFQSHCQDVFMYAHGLHDDPVAISNLSFSTKHEILHDQIVRQNANNFCALHALPHNTKDNWRRTTVYE